MNYYVGLLKSKKCYVMFSAEKQPTKQRYKWFSRVFGPFKTEKKANEFKRVAKASWGYKENPVVCRCVKVHGKYHSNPGALYHKKMFHDFMLQADRSQLGSQEYIVALEKAYAHLESEGESIKRGIV